MKIIGLKPVGKNHYNPENAVILGKYRLVLTCNIRGQTPPDIMATPFTILSVCFCRLQVWPGYSTCIKQTDGGLYLCVDVSHKVLRNDSVLNVM